MGFGLNTLKGGFGGPSVGSHSRTPTADIAAAAAAAA